MTPDTSIFVEVLNELQPKWILEVGFFQGDSVTRMLANSAARAVSVDPMEGRDCRIGNVEIVKAKFPGRFEFMRKDSKLCRDDLKDYRFDLFFMDGDHSQSGTHNDFQLCLDLKIPMILVDDWDGDVTSTFDKWFKNSFDMIKIFTRTDGFRVAWLRNKTILPL